MLIDCLSMHRLTSRCKQDLFFLWNACEQGAYQRTVANIVVKIFVLQIRLDGEARTVAEFVDYASEPHQQVLYFYNLLRGKITWIEDSGLYGNQLVANILSCLDTDGDLSLSCQLNLLISSNCCIMYIVMLKHAKD